MKAQLIVETIKALISLGCPGFEDLGKEEVIKYHCPLDSNCAIIRYKPMPSNLGGYPGNYDFGGTAPIPKELYYYGAGGGGTTQILVKTKDGYITQEEACAKEKEKLRKLLWGRK